MSKNIKRVFRLIWAWEEDKEERWLREMAQKGWLLESYFFGFYTFLKSEPDDYIYSLDYPAYSDKLEYLGIFQDAGWEHVTEFFGWHYYRIKADNCKYPDIYSDNASKVQKYRNILRILIVITIMSLINFFNIVILNHHRFPGLSIIVLSTLLLLLYANYRIVKLIKKLENDL